MLERVVFMYRALEPRASFGQWERARVKRLDLVALLPWGRIGFRFTNSSYPRHQELASLRLSRRHGDVDWGFIVHAGFAANLRPPVAVCLPAGEFLRHLDRWLACRSFLEARQFLQQGMSQSGFTS